MLLTIIYGKVTSIQYIYKCACKNTVQQIYTLVQRHLPDEKRDPTVNNQVCHCMCNLLLYTPWPVLVFLT